MRIPARPLGVATLTLATLLQLLLPACQRAAPIPRRSSPRPTVVEPFPVLGASVRAIDADHAAWAYDVADLFEVHDEDGLIGTARESPRLFFDAAPDRTAAVCTGYEVTLIGGGTSLTTQIADIAPSTDSERCKGIATRGAGDVWMFVVPDPPVASRLCRHDGVSWTCAALAVVPSPGTLVLSAGHAWWLASDDLVALDTSAPEAEPLVVARDIGFGSLQASASAEAVLFVPGESTALDQSPRRIELDGAETVFEARSENERYVDVWLTADDRVLALDVARDGATECTTGIGLSVGTTCFTNWFWTQLVVFELGAGEPEELAHVDYASGGQRSVGIERASGTFVAGDQWYRLP